MEHHATMAETGNRIASIVRSAEAASISVLDDIDATVDALQGVSKIMSGVQAVLMSLSDSLSDKDIKEGVYLDPDDVAIDAIEISASTLKGFLTKLVVKRSTIDRDNRLKGHHCEALHDAYEEAMTATAELVEEMDNVRSMIIARDLAAEPNADSPSYETIDALIANLRAC